MMIPLPHLVLFTRGEARGIIIVATLWCVFQKDGTCHVGLHDGRFPATVNEHDVYREREVWDGYCMQCPRMIQWQCPAALL